MAGSGAPGLNSAPGYFPNDTRLRGRDRQLRRTLPPSNGNPAGVPGAFSQVRAGVTPEGLQPSGLLDAVSGKFGLSHNSGNGPQSMARRMGRVSVRVSSLPRGKKGRGGGSRKGKAGAKVYQMAGPAPYEGGFDASKQNLTFGLDAATAQPSAKSNKGGAKHTMFRRGRRGRRRQPLIKTSPQGPGTRSEALAPVVCVDKDGNSCTERQP